MRGRYRKTLSGIGKKARSTHFFFAAGIPFFSSSAWLVFVNCRDNSRSLVEKKREVSEYVRSWVTWFVHGLRGPDPNVAPSGQSQFPTFAFSLDHTID